MLTDIRMPPTHTDEGIRLAAELRETHPRMGVVILSQFSDPIYALALLEHGSDGRAYLLKERVHNRAELMAAIRAVAEGGSMIDPKVVEALVVARGRAQSSPLNELTSRELQVLAEIAQGKSNTAIAESLFLTKRAVEKHINAIFWKLGLADARRRQQARQGRADVPGRRGREPRQLSRGRVGRVDAPRCARAGPAARAGGRRRGSAGSRRTAGSPPAACRPGARSAARSDTGSPLRAQTTRTPMTRAPGVCPVVDQNVAK